MAQNKNAETPGIVRGLSKSENTHCEQEPILENC